MTPPATVAVRALCDFTAKTGDLDLRFTPSPTALDGIVGHGLVAARRGAGWQAERALAGSHRGLQVRGRADGVDAARGRLEEIKTHKGRLDAMPANHRALHWAQARVYGALLCAELGLAEVELALVYLDIGSQQETVFTERCTAGGLQAFFEALCERYLAWAAQEQAHRAARDAALAALAFPQPQWREGQRTLAEGVYRAAVAGRCLLAQAPTGIGKTLGTLFPLLKACPEQELDKLFFLSAKTPGRALALQALASIRATSTGLPLRVVELVARDKACEHPDKACHGDSCPLARGFYDRLPAARLAATQALQEGADAVADGTESVHRTGTKRVRDIALAHQVCPYYLTQELVRWADVVVGDYNYFFDGSGLLHGLTQANDWRVAVLVDEAHNLVDRARAMYSTSLDAESLRQVRRVAPPVLKRPLDRLHRAWKAVLKAQAQTYAVVDLPDKFVATLQEAVNGITELFAAEPTRVDADLQRFYFDAMQFARLAESFGTHSMFDVSQPEIDRPRARGAGHASTLNIRNIVPAPFLKPRLASARTTVLFSATLTPPHYYADLLGLPDDTAWLEVEAPFRAEQLSVRLIDTVSTRFEHRHASAEPIARLMAQQFRAEPGNYLAFFSSFDYLDQMRQVFLRNHAEVPHWAQERRMGEAQREAFLARFDEGGQGIGFAVLGGAFAEGIDLPGRRLIGAFVATLGLPPVNAVNEEMRRRIGAQFGAGFDYTYLFPGLRKVVQAAGRVIRTPSDHGTVYLIDDRFKRPEVTRLLPRWWTVSCGSVPDTP